MAHQSTQISLENLDKFEEKLILNSPRSIKACKLEGIKLKELLYIPKSKFQDGVTQEQIVEL